jgi:ribosomal protein S18 acetylase RimI-like enzyme
MALHIVRRPAGADCAAIIADLPEWFGRPKVNAEYVELAERQQAWVAESDGKAVGVMILSDPGFSAIEIHFVAVRRDAHRQGVGRALVGKACSEARSCKRPYLTVKTLGSSAASEPYAVTRAFYRSVGFEPLEESAGIWGPETPCLLMVMPTAT